MTRLWNCKDWREADIDIKHSAPSSRTGKQATAKGGAGAGNGADSHNIEQVCADNGSPVAVRIMNSMTK